jgi:hypothetical protein
MLPILLAQQKLPKLRSCPTLQKFTVVEREDLYTNTNKHSLRCNAVSSKSVPAQSSAEVLGRGRLFLAARMTRQLQATVSVSAG